MKNDPDQMSFGEDEFLTLRVSGGLQVGERLILIGRPRQGSVRVREWTTETFNTAGHEYDIAAADLLASLNATHMAGGSLGTELYRVQLWLNG
ncbi:MAG: hypothetical protein ABI877_08095 [Gemmatimonadaceae bacterium]